ncbi:WD repeat-containing protein 61 [Smittium culicis]|uniref:WD repeat-containing protein 61 n=1 Tax=Smittium culicis TaxID=133412 RepID=A0A1R1YAE4_9FUNG|nr:WD repeat-containing protein 61 [Smittium culicis]
MLCRRNNKNMVYLIYHTLSSYTFLLITTFSSTLFSTTTRDANEGELLGLIKDLDYAFVSLHLNTPQTLDAWKAKFINNDSMAICGSDKGVLTVWDLGLENSDKAPSTNASPMVSILDTTKKQLINCISSSSADSIVAAGNSVGNIYTFDLSTNQLLNEFIAHSDIVRDVAIGKNSNLLYSCSDDKRILVYDIRHKNAVMSLQGHKGWVMGISLCLDDRLLASASSDSTSNLWDLRSKSCVQSLSTSPSEVWNVSFEQSSDAPRLASVGEDSLIQFYKPISL